MGFERLPPPPLQEEVWNLNPKLHGFCLKAENRESKVWQIKTRCAAFYSVQVETARARAVVGCQWPAVSLFASFRASRKFISNGEQEAAAAAARCGLLLLQQDAQQGSRQLRRLCGFPTRFLLHLTFKFEIKFEFIEIKVKACSCWLPTLRAGGGRQQRLCRKLNEGSVGCRSVQLFLFKR